jgi:monooxygenase
VQVAAITESVGDPAGQGVEHVDVLIIGAGISGIGCAYYLQQRHPDRSFVILEGRSALGGTWDLFRYPGIRSDSDLHTFGYAFKPWESDTVIAPGDQILDYIRETAEENGITEKIRLNRWVSSAAWSSEDARWLVEVTDRDSGERSQISCNWLFGGTGYYRYDEGFTPDLPGLENYQGQVVHPQRWPEDLDYKGKRVVVIGSGATAVTLVPAMAGDTEHITMLQRSPSYVLSIPSEDPIARLLRRLFGRERGFELTRRKNIFMMTSIYKFCQRRPRRARKVLMGMVAKALPEGYPVQEHFNPKYDPWDQRLCFVPDGDLFRVLRDGSASVATGLIDTFTPTGIRLQSGEELEADIVVTATGLNLLAFGGIELTVDGRPVNLPETLAFRGMMLSDVPNFAYLVGYTNASWTLKVDLVCEHFCRLLSYADEHGYDTCVAEMPYPNMTTRPLLNFQAGYVLRSLDKFPRQGSYAPWQLAMNFKVDHRNLKEGPVQDRNLRFSKVSDTDATRMVASDLEVAA